jgi:hypothetical protein
VSQGWSYSDEAMDAADDVYLRAMPPVGLDRFAEGVLTAKDGRPLLPTRVEREIYADVLFDMGRLLEEVR